MNGSAWGRGILTWSCGAIQEKGKVEKTRGRQEARGARKKLEKCVQSKEKPLILGIGLRTFKKALFMNFKCAVLYVIQHLFRITPVFDEIY